MAQYCRYCSFCCYGDTAYCTDHDAVLSDRKIRQTNQCKDFALSELGDVETGKIYHPRTARDKSIKKSEQLSLF